MICHAARLVGAGWSKRGDDTAAGAAVGGKRGDEGRRQGLGIHACRDPVDFRAGINGLSIHVETTLKFDSFSVNLFCFVNKRRNQIKILYWVRRDNQDETAVSPRLTRYNWEKSASVIRGLPCGEGMSRGLLK